MKQVSDISQQFLLPKKLSSFTVEFPVHIMQINSIGVWQNLIADRIQIVMAFVVAPDTSKQHTHTHTMRCNKPKMLLFTPFLCIRASL